MKKVISFENRESQYDVITEIKYSYENGLFQIEVRSHIHGQGFSDWTKLKARRMSENDAKILLENCKTKEIL